MKAPARDAQKNIRFSVAELATLNTAALAADQTLAEFVRCAALERAAAQAQRDTMLDLFERLMQDRGDSMERRLVDRIGSAADVAAADSLAAVEKRSAAVYERIVDRHQAAADANSAAIRDRLDRVEALLLGLTKGLAGLSPVAPVHVCPKCNQGHMVAETVGKGVNAGKTFYACPSCKHTSWKPDGS
ncbi:hypothetical protein [Burkholderia cenocepacia]|uniref:hypothetical protein n=1 Tax=Burkholderia cenocepacia TaxID=95486 RepID=UPI001B9B94AB|nr:hypothetical protein [Burkholderia cenocepacia]MBR7945434.1 hypothetical protein [Burkholderia cenocepacia]